MSSSRPLKIILSGGGTGGHIFPAIAIANEIRRISPGADVLFVGALGRMEMEKVPAAGYRIVGVPIAGLQRKFSLKNFKLPWLILQSLMKTRRIISDFRPDVVVGTGGYASAPVLYAATSKKVPALIQEQNSYAGITNKFLSKRVQRICVAYQNMDKFFPREKIILTGNPVRQDILDLSAKRKEGLEHFGLDASKRTLLVIGGSLGARTINEAISSGSGKFAEAGIQVLWQTGKSFGEKGRAAALAGHHMKVHEFIMRMDLAYAVADAVVSRAGASSVSELCITGLPSVLVPSPNVAEDHQTMNALALLEKDAALMVKDGEAAAALCDTAIKLLNDTELSEKLQFNIRKLALPDAAKMIAAEVLKIARYQG